MPKWIEQLELDPGPPAPDEWLTYDLIEQATFRPERPPTMSVTEAARMLGISRTMANEAVRDGSLLSIRVRRRIVIPVAWWVRVVDGRGWLRE